MRNTYINLLSKFVKAVGCCFHMPPQKSHENPISHFQKLTSKKWTYFLKIFFYIRTGETFTYIVLKNQCWSFTVSMHFLRRKKKCAILFACVILLALLPHTPQKKNSLLMIFLKISSLEPHLKLATKLGVYEPCRNLFLKLAKIFRRRF